MRTAARAISPPVVSAPSSTGMRGKFRLPEHVVLGAEEDPGDGEHDRDDEPEQPDRKALARPVEAGHPAADVTAGVVRDGEDDQQQDAADDPDRVGGARGLVGRRLGKPDGRTGGAQERDQQDGETDGHEPAEERAAPAEAAELLALALARLVEARSCAVALALGGRGGAAPAVLGSRAHDATYRSRRNAAAAWSVSLPLSPRCRARP